MGHMMMERVNGEDVRADRLWLERRTPFPRRGMPKLRERPPDRLTDEEADRLRALPDPHGFVCRLALGTGLPWGELCGAQAADVERGFLLAQSHAVSECAAG